MAVPLPCESPREPRLNGDIALMARDVTLVLGSGEARVEVLRGVSLSVDRGERVGIVGPSGSGKSSLMAVMAGLERATSGEIAIDGTSLSGLSEDALARARRGRVGIVLQAFHLLPAMTALENVAVALDLAGHSDPFPRAAEELSAVGLSGRLGHYPAQLSGGEQQRVAIARALAPRPALVFADEPTGNLDQATGAGVIDLLFARLEETGGTLVLITHDDALARRCNRIVRMLDGRIVDGAAA